MNRGPFALPRVTEPPARDPGCLIFAWIGQPFSSCETCSTPYWEHLYDPPYGGARPIFYVKQRRYPRSEEWVWRAVGSIITRKVAERTAASHGVDPALMLVRRENHLATSGRR